MVCRIEYILNNKTELSCINISKFLKKILRTHCAPKNDTEKFSFNLPLRNLKKYNYSLNFLLETEKNPEWLFALAQQFWMGADSAWAVLDPAKQSQQKELWHCKCHDAKGNIIESTEGVELITISISNAGHEP